jgi:hypothetical protein
MTAFLSARQICEAALRKVGAFPTSDTAAEPEHMKEAMRWLALRLDHIAGSRRREWLISPTLTVPLNIANQKTYEISTQVGAAWPRQGFEHVIVAFVEDQYGNRWPVEVVDREKFEDVCKTAESGEPAWIYFDRLTNRDLSPEVSVWPVPTVTTYLLKIIMQMNAPDIMPSGVSGDDIDGALAHGLRRTWQLWAVFQLAADLGSGPIRHLPVERFNLFTAQAERALADLENVEDREKTTGPPICASGFDYEIERGPWPDTWRADT